MNTKQFHRRVWAVVVLLALMLTGMGATLYDLQINQGEAYYSQSQHKLPETEVVEAARGLILDRNGRVLVSNRVVYQVVLDTDLMEEQRSRILLELVRAAEESEVTWTDNLPISRQEPFSFTADSPYYTVSRDEEGNLTRNLTRLGRLAVRMRWIQDPTRDEESEEETAPVVQEPDFWDRAAEFFFGSGEESIPVVQEPEKAYTLPSAEELLELMWASYGLTEKGEDGQTALTPADMSRAEARAVAGVLYELSLRERAETSDAVRQRVNQARALQRSRQPSAPCNAQLGREELDRFCALDESCQRLMKGAFDRMGLTARSYDRILRVARTIADLDGSGSIQVPHLAEALQYRPPEYLRR